MKHNVLMIQCSWWYF